MKIAWFSPLPPARSDIANFTERLRRDLQRHFETRFFAEAHEGFCEPSTGKGYPAGPGRASDDFLVSLNDGDLPIYNLGNNPEFFAQTWLLGQLKPGLVILHDVKLHHFFEGLYRERLNDAERYLDLLEEYHGPIAREAGQAFCRSKVSINFMAEHFPMTAWAIRNALGVVVHSSYALEKVREAASTPAWMIPLPYRPEGTRSKDTPATNPSSNRNFSPERRVKLVIFGHLNVNRRIIEFLHALATLHERDLFEVHIVGTVFHQREVSAAVDLLGIRNQVTFYGFIPDAELESVLERMDLAINLRYPTMGEASGSQLRIWDHALPSLVTRSGAYAELPPETVFFVRPEQERCDIQRHLRHFLRRPEFFREKGRRARRWLLDHHLPAMYVEALRPICEQAAALRSRYNRLTIADRVGHATTPWADAGPSGECDRSHAARIAEMF